MAFTEQQLETIGNFVEGYYDDVAEVRVEGFAEKCEKLLRIRDELRPLLSELHNGFSDNAELMAIIATAKARGKVVADELSAMFT